MKKIDYYIVFGVFAALVISGAAFLYFHMDDETPETKVWITNNSNETVKVSVEYNSDVCPEKCKLELGAFAINEGRGTFFANPREATFWVSAEFPDGRRIVSNGEYAERNFGFGSIIWNDRIEIDSPYDSK